MPSSKVITTSVTAVDALLPSWRRSLRAAHKSPKTIESYLSSAEQFSAFLIDRGMPTDVASIHREHVESWIEDILERRKPTTAAVRYRSLQQFFKWALEEGELTISPMVNTHPPKLDDIPVPVLDAASLAALLAAAAGTDFEHRRDTAIIRCFLATGARLAELADLHLDVDVEVPHVDLDADRLYVVGKGRKGRFLPLGPKVSRDLDRYLRIRRSHPHAASPWLWIGRKGRLTSGGIYEMLGRRAEQAGTRPHPSSPASAHVRFGLAEGRGGRKVISCGWPDGRAGTW